MTAAMNSPLRSELFSSPAPPTPRDASTPINAAAAFVQRTHSPSTRRRRSTRASPYHRASGGALVHSSPSRQLIDEYARWQHESDRQFKEQLDAHETELKRLHDSELAAAAAKSREVLAGVEKQRELLAMRIENEKRRKKLEEEEHQERVRQERIRLEREEAQQKLDVAKQREREAQEAREQARLMKEAEAKAQEERTRLEAEQRQQDQLREQQRKQTEEKQRQESAAQQLAQQTNGVNETNGTTAPTSRMEQAPVTASLSNANNTQSPSGSLEDDHNAYLALHKKLKDMRKHVLAEWKKAKQNPQKTLLKELGNMRRELQKLLGQTTSDLKKNRELREKITATFKSAWNNTEVAVNAKELIIRPTHPFQPGSNVQVSGMFVYLLNILIKACIRQWEASSRQTAYNASDYYGVIISWIISEPDFNANGNTFADIILAKYHHACPPIFGIHGAENTQQGRARLGWSRDAEGSFVDKQTHNDRVNALAIGWGALTLRDYSRTTRHNGLPAWMYWRSMAGIVNAQPQHLNQTLAIVLKGMIDLYAHLFVKFYGQAAVVALRRAVVELPQQAAQGSGWETVMVVRDNLRNNYGLAL